MLTEMMKASAAKALGRLGLELHRHESRRTAELLRRRHADLVIEAGAAWGEYGFSPAQSRIPRRHS
jgi:hypothetical protein